MSDVDTVAAESTVPDANPADEVTQDVTPETEATTPEPSPEAPDPGKEKDGLLKKINKLTWQRREAERERELYRQRVEAFERQQKATEQPAVSETRETLADWGYDEAAYAKDRERRAEERAIRLVEQNLKEKQERETKQRIHSEFRKREESFAESVSDYEEFAYSAPISTEVANLVRHMDEGPAVAYYLGKNPDLAEQLSQLPNDVAGIQLGRLEAKLIAEREKAKERSISKAPPPTPKLDASNASPKVSTADASGDVLDDATWFEMEKKRMARKRAGK